MITLDGLQLPDNLIWQDELDWTPVAGSYKYTLQGRLILFAVARNNDAGRPITLGGGVWVRRSLLLTLSEWAAEPYRRMELRLHDGVSRSVFWRVGEMPISAVPVIGSLADPRGETMYSLDALRLMVA